MSRSKRRSDGASSCRRRVYPAAALALSSIFLFGLASKFDLFSPGHLPGFVDKKPVYDFPDFNKVIQVYTLSEGELGLNDPNRRALFIGDIHGMNKSFHHLLSAASYDPARDTIILAGDIMSKSTLSGSLAILDFVTQHKCGAVPGPLYAVRGNHDQTIVQWRAWRDWFEPLQLSIPSALVSASDPNAHPGPQAKTGREFLELIEHEWQHDVERDPKGSADPDEWAGVARKRAVGTWREEWWRRVPQPGKGHQNKDWPIFDDHYWLAREMSSEQKACLYSLPFVLHVPSEHFFVAHAGLLPYDPKRPLTDKQAQTALASTPVAVTIPKNETFELLRVMQQRALLTDIPGNRDPWVLVNMRGIRKKKRKVTRDNNKGTPWSEVWNEQMELCKGFDIAPPTDSDDRRLSLSGRLGDETDLEALPCEPATVVYGHAATRSLDIKRWSMGIDTGCVYGRRLTSLVLQKPNGTALLQIRESDDVDEDTEDMDDLNSRWSDASDAPSLREEPDMPYSRRKPRAKKVHFGDDDAGVDAHVISVRCPDMGD